MSIGQAFEDTTERIKRQGTRRTPDSPLLPVLSAMPYSDGKAKRKQIVFTGDVPDNDAISAIVLGGEGDAGEQAALFRKELWKAARQAGVSARSSVAELDDGRVLVQFWVAGPFKPRGSNGQEDEDE
jgi:hypothetical protein